MISFRQVADCLKGVNKLRPFILSSNKGENKMSWEFNGSNYKSFITEETKEEGKKNGGIYITFESRSSSNIAFFRDLAIFFEEINDILICYLMLSFFSK